MSNAFAKKITAKKETSTLKDAKAVAQVTDEIKTKVDSFINNKSEIKRLEAEQITLEEAIVSHVRPQQDEMAYCGSFTKSLTVPGDNYTVTYVTMDRFSVPQDEPSLQAIKALVGPTKYDEMFETKETISIKKEVVGNDALLNKIAKACEDAGLDISLYFDRTEKVVSKDDLDRKQFELKPNKLEQFRALVKQAKPSLR